MLEAGFNYYSKDRLYLWKKEQKSEMPTVVQAPAAPAREKLGLTGGKLKELAWSLDIKDQNQTPH
jgi:hypothetical protein